MVTSMGLFNAIATGSPHRSRQRARSAWARLALLLLLTLAGFNLAAQPLRAIPKLTSPVTDTTGTLDAATQATLRERSLDLQRRKGAQLMLLMIDSTGAESIEAYAQRVFEQWKPGRAGVDDGVLIVVAKADRHMRIHVGYGLEQTITNEASTQVIDEYLTPAFRKGDYGEGLLRGSDALIGLIDGTPLPEPDDSMPMPVLIFEWIFGTLFALPFIVVPLLGIRAAWRRGPLAFFGRWAIVAVVGGWGLVMTYLNMPGDANWEHWMPLVLITYLTTLFTFFTAFGERSWRSGPRGDDDDDRRRRRSRSSSSSSSSSGYSGGGGRSGGSGSSGSW